MNRKTFGVLKIYRTIQNLHIIGVGMRNEVTIKKLLFDKERGIVNGLFWLHEGITKSMQNSETNNNELPMAKLNSDATVSFIFHCCNESSCEDCNTLGAFKAILDADDFSEQIEYLHKTKGLDFINNAERPIDKIEKEELELVEYRFNLSPEDLDNILKKNYLYSGYRYGFSLLTLVRADESKLGFIRLSPMYCIDDKQSYLLRVAGCQISEMPILELIRRMPDKPKRIRIHWEHKEVQFIDRLVLISILNDILIEAKMISLDEKISIQGSNGLISIKPPTGATGVKIVDIDRNTLDFYAKYSNCSSEELNNNGYKSLEICTVDFLTRIKKYHEEKKLEEVFKPIKKLLDEMIEIEKKQLNQAKTIKNKLNMSLFSEGSKNDELLLQANVTNTKML